MRTPEECPVCGDDVPRGARACPHCGADERAGWNEDATRYDGLDLPGAEPEEASPEAGAAPGWVRWVAAALLLAVLGWMAARFL